MPKSRNSGPRAKLRATLAACSALVACCASPVVWSEGDDEVTSEVIPVGELVVTDVSTRVKHGEDCTFPWVAALGRATKLTEKLYRLHVECTGVLVSPHVVLTAAHCKKTCAYVMPGVQHVEQVSPRPGLKFEEPHPIGDTDMMLIRFCDKEQHPKVLRGPLESVLPTVKFGIVASFGKSGTGPHNRDLQQATLEVRSPRDCNFKQGNPQMCVCGVKQWICGADSGAPFLTSDSRHLLLGIVKSSQDAGCVMTDGPVCGGVWPLTDPNDEIDKYIERAEKACK